MLGWLVWGVLSLLALGAGYTVAAATYGHRSSADRVVVCLISTTILTLSPLLGLGLFGLVRAPLLGAVSLVVFVGTAALATRKIGRAKLHACFRHDLGTPMRTLRDAWREREPLVLALLLGLSAIALTLVLVWIFRSWNYDGTVYHVPITAYVIQDGSILKIDSHSPWIVGYPFNVELLAVWNCIFMRDNRLDDAPQILFALLGSAVIAAWARRLGSSRPLALGLGCVFLALPPNLLQMSSNQVDIACGALFATAVYFMSFGNERRDRWVCFLAFGLYVGTKFSGLLHLLILAPWIVVRLIGEVASAKQKLRRLGDVGLSALALLALGATKYIDNAITRKNPTYPFTLHVPIIDKTFPGYIDSTAVYGAPPGSSGAFFAVPGDFKKMLESWMDTDPILWPDARSGGYGPAFRYLLVPCVLLLLLCALWPNKWRRALPPVILFVAALAVPAAYWPRYTVGAACASLVAFAVIHEWIPPWWAKRALSLALVGLATSGAYFTLHTLYTKRDFYMWPDHLKPLLRASAEQQRTARVVDWLWPTEWAALREKELRPGDVVVYDESADFISEYFTHDYRTKVGFVSSAGTPEEYVRQVRKRHAHWAGVTAGTAAESALHESGAEFLFNAPRSQTAIYRVKYR